MRAKTIQILWHDKQPIFSMDFSPVFNTLVTAGGSLLRVWKIQDSQVEYQTTLDRHQSTINTVRFHQQLLASGGDDGTIIMWEPNEGEYKVRGVLRGPSDCYDICWSPDGSKIASAGIDHTIRVYCTRENKCLYVLSQHQHFVQGVAWDPSGTYLCSQSSDRALHVYKTDTLKTPKLLHKFNKLEGKKMYQDEDLNSFFRRLSFSPDGSILVTPAGVSPDQQSFCAYVYDRKAIGGGPFSYLPGHKRSVIGVRFNPMRYRSKVKDEKFIYAVCTFDTVVLYDTDYVKPIASISNLHYATLTDLAWNFDGTVLFMSSTDGFCSMVEFAPGELGEPIPKEEWKPLESIEMVKEASVDREEKKDSLNEKTVIQVDEKEIMQVDEKPTVEIPSKNTAEALAAPEPKKRRIVPTFLGTSS